MKLIFNSTYIVLLFCLFYAVKSMIDPKTWSTVTRIVAGDYPMFWNKYFSSDYPMIAEKYFVGWFTLSSPITHVLLAIVVLGIVRVVVERKKHEYR